jgi:hypothetical protein
MKIREGAYYRTRGGRIIGPMKHVDYRAEKWSFCALGFHDGAPCWTDEGRWCEFDDSHDMDLISEVYVSDTPPTFIPIGTFSGGGSGGGASTSAPAPETKTLRDEFAMAALQGMLARYDYRASYVARDAYEYADAMMEARKE